MTKREQSSQDPIETLAELIEGIEVAMLTSVADDGSLHSRPMATQNHRFDGTIWFFTRQDSPKVGEVQHERAVSVTYSDPHQQRYVAVAGRCEVVTDREKMRELWKPSLRAWFPDGLDDPQLSLLRIEVQEAQYWTSPTAAAVRLAGFLKGIATGKPYPGGEHEHVSFHR